MRFAVDPTVSGKFPPLEAALCVLGVEVSAQHGKHLAVGVGMEEMSGFFKGTSTSPAR